MIIVLNKAFVFFTFHAKFASFTVQVIFDCGLDSLEEISLEGSWTLNNWFSIDFQFLFDHSCKFKNFS